MFTSSSGTPTIGDWHGIRVVTAGTSESVILDNCTVSYGALGIDVRASGAGATVSTSITNSVFEHISGTGIVLHGTAGAVFDPVTVTDNQVLGNVGDHGIYFYMADAGTNMTSVDQRQHRDRQRQFRGSCGHYYTNATGHVNTDGQHGERQRRCGCTLSAPTIRRTSNLTITDNMLTGNGARYGVVPSVTVMYLWTWITAPRARLLVDGNRGDRSGRDDGQRWTSTARRRDL